MVNATEWLNQNYPKETRSQIIELDISNKNLEGWLELWSFPNLEHLSCSSNNLTKINTSSCSKLVKINCHSNQFTSLDVTSNEDLTEFNCSNNQLTSLDLHDCPNLTVLDCSNNQLVNLNISENSQLTLLNCCENRLTSLNVKENINLIRLDFSDNWLTDFAFSTLNPQTLNFLNISNNNFSLRKLTCFQTLVNLESLALINDKRDKIQQGIYNRFFGNLKPLKNLSKLIVLDISNTDVDEGLEYLPSSVEKVFCSSTQRGSKLKVIEQSLKSCGGDIKRWRVVNHNLIEKTKRIEELEKQLQSEWLTKEQLQKNKDDLILENLEKTKKIETLSVKLQEKSVELIATNRQIAHEWRELAAVILGEQVGEKVNFEGLKSFLKNFVESKRQEVENLENELIIEQEHDQVMDDWYRRQFIEDKDPEYFIRNSFSKEFLKINLENKQKDQKIKELEKNVEIIKQFVEQSWQHRQEEERKENNEKIQIKQREIENLENKLNEISLATTELRNKKKELENLKIEILNRQVHRNSGEVPWNQKNKLEKEIELLQNKLAKVQSPQIKQMEDELKEAKKAEEIIKKENVRLESVLKEIWESEQTVRLQELQTELTEKENECQQLKKVLNSWNQGVTARWEKSNNLRVAKDKKNSDGSETEQISQIQIPPK